MMMMNRTVDKKEDERDKKKKTKYITINTGHLREEA